jgi:hypothetical protein
MSFNHLGHKLSAQLPSTKVASGFYGLLRSLYFVLLAVPLMAFAIAVIVIMALVIGLGGSRDSEI